MDRKTNAPLLPARAVNLLLVLPLLPALCGCYAGAVGIGLGVVALTGSDSSDRGPVGSVSALQVMSDLPGQPPSGDPELVAQIEELLREERRGEAPQDFLSGDSVHFRFQLEIIPPPSDGDFKAKGLARVMRKDGTTTVSRARLRDLQTGSNERTCDLPILLGREGTEELLLRVEVGGGAAKEVPIFVNRSAPRSVPRLTQVRSETCAGGGDLQGTVTLDYEADRLLPQGALRLVIREIAPEFGRLRLVSPQSLSIQPGAECNGGPCMVSVSWPSGAANAPYADRSADIVPLLVVVDEEAPKKLILSLSGPENLDEGMHLNNSRPEVLRDVTVTTVPAGGGSREGDGVGLVAVDYTTRDGGSVEGSEECRLNLTVVLSDSIVLTTRQDIAGEPLTEAVGAVCDSPLEGVERDRSEGTGPFSQDGDTPHRFIWNSDHDLDRLVRQGRLPEGKPRVLDGAVLTISVTDSGSCRESIPVVRRLGVLDNTLMHSVAGLIPGQSSPGGGDPGAVDAVPAGKATFETLSAMAFDADERFLYLADAGVNTIWRMDTSLPEDRRELVRFAGEGARRTDQPPAIFADRAAQSALLDQPNAVEVDGAGRLYFLEDRGSALWRVTAGKLELLLDNQVLRAPDDFVLDEEGGFLHILDTRNCRLLSYDLSLPPDLDPASPTANPRVVLGAVEEPKFRDFLLRFFLEKGIELSVEELGPAGINACNYIERFNDLYANKHPLSVAAGDIDGDADADLVTANPGSDDISVLENTGGRGFATRVDYSVGPGASEATSVSLVDVDGDLKLDIVSANEVSGMIVTVLKNRGDGTFSGAATYLNANNGRFADAADFDGDGDQDLAVANGPNRITILPNDGAGGFGGAPTQLTAGSRPRSVVARDIDGDGNLDLLAANSGRLEDAGERGSLSLLWGRSGGTFDPAVALDSGAKPFQAIAADIDGDDRLDIVAANNQSNDIALLRNAGNRSFAPPVVFPAGMGPSSLAAADVNIDGRPDIAVASQVSGDLRVFLNNGTGGFVVPAVVYASGAGARTVVAAGVDVDAHLDLIVANPALNSVALFYGRGGGAFEAAAIECFGACADFGALPSEILSEPGGVALYQSRAGAFLFVADSGNRRILRVALGDPDPAASVRTVLTRQRRDDDPGDDTAELFGEFCDVKSVRTLSQGGQPFLYIVFQDVLSTGGGRAQGVVARSRITVDEEGRPFLLPLEVVSGKPEGADVDCSKSNNGVSSFRARDECAPALEAHLSNPEDIRVDRSGNVYLCDSRNGRLRLIGNGSGTCVPQGSPVPGGEVSDAGRIRTVVGDTVEGRSRSDCEAFSDRLCVGEDPAESEGSGELAVASKLAEPFGLALLDERTLVFTDSRNHRVRRLDLKTGLITTLAGRRRTDEEDDEGGPRFGGDGGPAKDALLNTPRGMAAHPRADAAGAGFCADPARRLYFVDGDNRRLRVIEADGTIRTVAGPEGLEEPRSVAVDRMGRLFVSDVACDCIQQVGDRGALTRVIGRQAPAGNPLDPDSLGDGGPAANAKLENPQDMVFDPADEYLYLADEGNNRVRRVWYDGRNGTFGEITTVAGTGSTETLQDVPPETPALDLPLGSPYGVAFHPGDAAGRFLYLTESAGGSRVFRVTLDADPRANTITRVAGSVFGAAGDGDEALNAQLANPRGLILDAAGNVYAADSRNHRVRRFFPAPPGE